MFLVAIEGVLEIELSNCFSFASPSWYVKSFGCRGAKHPNIENSIKNDMNMFKFYKNERFETIEKMIILV
jgi:hypothetical protein